jgi:hypothetical protein
LELPPIPVDAQLLEIPDQDEKAKGEDHPRNKKLHKFETVSLSISF